MQSRVCPPHELRRVALWVLISCIVVIPLLEPPSAAASAVVLPTGVHVAENVNDSYAEDPPAVDLRSKIPSPIDQGALGACTTYALTYVVGSFWSGRTLNPLPTYAQGLAMRSGGDRPQFSSNGGITIFEAYSAMLSFGSYDVVGKVRRSTWHLIPPTPGSGHFEGMDILRLGPSVGQGPIGQVVRHVLAAGRPIVLVMHYSPELALGFTGARLSLTSEAERYHAVAAVGYTADGVIIQNSRGQSWGRRGFAVAPWAVMEQLTVEAYAPFGWSANSDISASNQRLPTDKDADFADAVRPRGSDRDGSFQSKLLM